MKPQYSFAIANKRSKPNRSVVVPHVLRIILCGQTNMEDSLAVKESYGQLREL